MLIDEGANKNLRDAQDMSPLDHAKEKVNYNSSYRLSLINGQECITIIGMLEKAGKRGKEVSNRINC